MANWWDWMTQEGVVDDDVQYALAGLAKAVNPRGVTGNIGEMFQKYIQGIQARKGFNERMQKNDLFMQALIKAMSGKTGSELDNLGNAMSSQNWFNMWGDQARRWGAPSPETMRYMKGWR